jgi:bacterioferritin
VVSVLNKINIGKDIEAQLHRDWDAERDAIRSYNQGVQLCVELEDNGTRHILEEILTDEEDHIDWLEAQLDQIEQIGIQNYLIEQID